MYCFKTFIAAILLTTFVASAARAQLQDPEKGVGVEEKVDADLPLHLIFRDHNENKVELGDFFNNGRPVILTLNYSDCPMLCNLQLSGLVTAMREMQDLPNKFTIGKDFDIVTVSIDPNESSKKIRETREKYTFLYGNQNATKTGWHFLRGRQNSIQELAETVGFQYHFRRSNKEFAHPPVFMVCSNEGKILRYVHGVSFEPQKLESVVEQSLEGKSGKSLGQFIFSCLMLREFTGKNSAQMMTVMRFGGAATVLVLIGLMIPFWFSKSRKLSEEEQPGKLKNSEQSENQETIKNEVSRD